MEVWMIFNNRKDHVVDNDNENQLKLKEIRTNFLVDKSICIQYSSKIWKYAGAIFWYIL